MSFLAAVRPAHSIFDRINTFQTRKAIATVRNVLKMPMITPHIVHDDAISEVNTNATRQKNMDTTKNT